MRGVRHAAATGVCGTLLFCLVACDDLVLGPPPGGATGASGGAASSGAGAEGGGGPCTFGEGRCAGPHGNGIEICDETGTWGGSVLCEAACSGGACVSPPSCNGSLQCGSNESCCASYLVPGGTFARSYDAAGYDNDSFHATVSSFLLDRYEVTVGRFRNWVAAYDQSGAKPQPGSGANPANPADMGWDSQWDAALPSNKAALLGSLACGAASWTTSPGSNEDKPINCIDWYIAGAFCIWDGGRLPTEAEWNYAAAGGDEQRAYPWSTPPQFKQIGPRYAVYSTTALAPVGSIVGSGDGKWGQRDLGGNVWEWVQDYFVDPYASTVCIDCAMLSPTERRTYRGGGYSSSAASVRVAYRESADPDGEAQSLGVRCARTP
ncbi:MAG: SUMF1/EgtB/PvdO family nonheme iron enzyme [Polyangiaceae bacterium]